MIFQVGQRCLLRCSGPSGGSSTEAGQSHGPGKEADEVSADRQECRPLTPGRGFWGSRRSAEPGQDGCGAVGLWDSEELELSGVECASGIGPANRTLHTAWGWDPDPPGPLTLRADGTRLGGAGEPQRYPDYAYVSMPILGAAGHGGGQQPPANSTNLLPGKLSSKGKLDLISNAPSSGGLGELADIPSGQWLTAGTLKCSSMFDYPGPS